MPASMTLQPRLLVCCAALLLATSVIPKAGGGILGSELDELEKAVDALPPVKDPPVKPADPITNPTRPTKPVEPPAKPGGDGVIMRDNPGALPGGIVIPPPPGSGPALITKGTLAEADWEFERDGGLAMRNGMLVFESSDEGQAPAATLRASLKGDFDLRVDYTLESIDAKKLRGAAFGLRIEKPNDEGQISIDRRNDPDDGGDAVRVRRGTDDKPLLSAKVTGAGGVLRVQRRGDRYEISHGNPEGTVWTDVGEITIALGDQAHLWMTTYTDWAAVRVTVHRVEITKPALP